jgi:pilus assembly protein CpaF
VSETDGDPRTRIERLRFHLPGERIPTSAPSRTTATAAPSAAPVRGSDYQSVKSSLHARLLDDLNVRNVFSASDEVLSAEVGQFLDRVFASEDPTLNETERLRLREDLIEETLGVGPLSPLMSDPAVTDILVNKYDLVFVERFGKLERTEVRFRDNDHLIRIIQRIAAQVGRRIDESSPMVDARLPDGSRVNATVPPITIDGPTLSIRRFGRRRLRRAELERLGMFTPAMERFFDLTVKLRKNILVSGGTGSGKSTLLAAVAEAIPDHERIITIEDAAELQIDQPNLIRKESRPANLEGRGRVTARDLVANSLRMRPDRIIVGEVRGGEALDMLQALNTGHDGGMTTIHANSPRDALARLETMVLMAGLDLPSRAIREQISSALDLVIHVRRYEDGVRRIEVVAEVVGQEGNTIQLDEIFRFKRSGQSGRRVEGRFVPTGVVPRIAREMAERGLEVPVDLFRVGEADGG